MTSDLLYGIRKLAHDKGFTCAAVLSLALGSGVNAAIFTLANAVFSAPFPWRIPLVWSPRIGWTMALREQPQPYAWIAKARERSECKWAGLSACRRLSSRRVVMSSPDLSPGGSPAAG